MKKTVSHPTGTQSHQQLRSAQELFLDAQQILEDALKDGVQYPSEELIAVGYTRVSSTMQVMEGYSLEDQEQRIVDYINGQGWQLLKMIADPAASGRTAKRHGFRQLKKLIANGRVQVVVVDRIDRIARHLPTFLAFIKLINDNNVQLISLREDFDYRHPWGKLVFYIFGAMAEFYSDILSEEIRTKRKMDAKNGKLSSTYRFGYCKGNCSKCNDPNGPDYCPYYGTPDRGESGTRIPHPVESQAVKLMASWYVTGKYSFADIARKLNHEIFTLPDGNEVHFRTKGRPGRTKPSRFDADAVRAILKNAVYAGFVTYAGSTEDGKKHRKPQEIYKGEHEALIDAFTYLRIQQIRKERRRRSEALTNTARTYPLSHLVTCAHRHNTMRTSSSKGKYRYYVDRVCQEKHEQQHQPNLPALTLEEQIRKFMGEIQLPEKWLNTIRGFVLYEEGESELMQARLEITQRLNLERELYLSGVMSKAEHNQKKKKLLNELADLDPEHNTLAREIEDLLRNLPLVLEAMEPEDENGLYCEMFTSIIVQEKDVVAMEVFPPFTQLHRRLTMPGTHSPILGEFEMP